MDNSNVHGNVLVVDDNAANRTMHRAILAKKFEVVTAASGREAIALCRENLPDLILLDIEMPDLDGIETCRRLREWTNIPIISKSEPNKCRVR
jgi:CheY-like chemotaxis protein